MSAPAPAAGRPDPGAGGSPEPSRADLACLRAELDALEELDREPARDVVRRLLDALERGNVRAAIPDPASESGWRVEAWVKAGILAAFRLGHDADARIGDLPFRDRDLLAPRTELPPRVRVVAGGSAVRRGAHLAPGVVVCPPAWINVGAFVGAGTLVDSHALVGSCAQIGARVHLSAAAQVGGVLEPAGSLPVVVEDDVFVGGGAGLYEGVVVGARAVIGAGVVLTASTPIVDLAGERLLRGDPGRGQPLVVPCGAVIVPGARAARGSFAREHGVTLATPVLVRYRDERTDARTALEAALRS